MMPYPHMFSNRDVPFTDEELTHIHSLYTGTTMPLRFIVSFKELVISLMHYQKAAQLRDIQIHIENGFQWKL